MNEFSDEIRKVLKKKLTKERYNHTIGVTYTSIALAMRYEYPLEKAELAGLLHDCAKNYPDGKKIEKCKELGVKLTETELRNTSLIHAKLGAEMAETRYGVHDPEIKAAISFHTTGRADMSLLEEIVFTADYIEPGRTKQPHLQELRKMAFVDLRECVYMILRDTVEYLDSVHSDTIDETTRTAYEWYRDLHNKKEKDT